MPDHFSNWPVFQGIFDGSCMDVLDFCFAELVLLNGAPLDNAEVETPTVREDKNIPFLS